MRALYLKQLVLTPELRSVRIYVSLSLSVFLTKVSSSSMLLEKRFFLWSAFSLQLLLSPIIGTARTGCIFNCKTTLYIFCPQVYWIITQAASIHRAHVVCWRERKEHSEALATQASCSLYCWALSVLAGFSGNRDSGWLLYWKEFGNLQATRRITAWWAKSSSNSRGCSIRGFDPTPEGLSQVSKPWAIKTCSSCIFGISFIYSILFYCTVFYSIISYHIILYHIISYYIILYYIILYYIISYGNIILYGATLICL